MVPTSRADELRSSPPPTTIDEHILFKVLDSANLANFHEKFIYIGVHGVLDLVQCSQTQFLEICSMVGLTRLPFQVVQFQRSLLEFLGQSWSRPVQVDLYDQVLLEKWSPEDEPDMRLLLGGELNEQLLDADRRGELSTETLRYFQFLLGDFQKIDSVELGERRLELCNRAVRSVFDSDVEYVYTIAQCLTERNSRLLLHKRLLVELSRRVLDKILAHTEGGRGAGQQQPSSTAGLSDAGVVTSPESSASSENGESTDGEAGGGPGEPIAAENQQETENAQNTRDSAILDDEKSSEMAPFPTPAPTDPQTSPGNTSQSQKHVTNNE